VVDFLKGYNPGAIIRAWSRFKRKTVFWDNLQNVECIMGYNKANLTIKNISEFVYELNNFELKDDIEINSPSQTLSKVELTDWTISTNRKLVIKNLSNANGKIKIKGFTITDGSELVLERLKSQEITIEDMVFEKNAKLIFKDCDLTKMTCPSLAIECVRIENPAWPKKNKRVLITAHKAAVKPRWRFLNCVSKPIDQDTIQPLIEQYRKWINLFEDTRDYRISEDFYFQEMDLQRQQKDTGFLHRQFLLLYKILSGFGTSYAQAALWLLLFLVLASIAFMFNGLEPAMDHTEPQIKYNCAFDILNKNFLPNFGHAFAHVLALVTFQKDKIYVAIGSTGSALASATLMVVSAQLAILFFAIRRRFRRGSI
jgi:hypothetical protein